MEWQELGGFLHTFWTVWLVALFVGIVVYAVWPGNRARFEDASRIPLREDGLEV